MTREPSDTFGRRYWKRPRADGRARTPDAAGWQALYDQQPKRGLIARILKGNRT